MGTVRQSQDGLTWNPMLAGGPGPQGPMGGVGNNRNWVINSDFSVNQRAFTSLVNPVGAQSYWLDHWRMVNNGAAGTTTFSVVAATVGELPESAPQFARIATAGHSGNDGRAALFHMIEDIRAMAGKYCTVSFWAKGSTRAWVGVELRQSIAGGGAGTTSQSKKILIDTGWARHYVTIWVPSLVGKTINVQTDETLQLLLWTSSGLDYNVRNDYTPVQNWTVDFWGVQAEEGDRLTPYEFKTYAEHFRDCQRFFQRWTQPAIRGITSSTAATSRMGMILPVPMRVAPTTAMSGQIPVYDGSGTGAIATIDNAYTTPSHIEYDTQSNAFTSPYRPCIAIQNGALFWDLSAEF